MRIIAGNLKGRTFDSPKSHKTHPMSDKMRAALFNILGDISGLRVLDAFAGSGALSFEAISRGAASVLALDSDRHAQQAVDRNIALLGLKGSVKLVKANAGAWLTTSDNDSLYDIALCDPPYTDLQPGLLLRLTEVVTPGGLFVLSWPGSRELPELPGVTLVEERSYGDGQLGFYRR